MSRRKRSKKRTWPMSGAAWMQEKKFCWWMFVKTTNGPMAIFPEQSISEGASSSATSRSRFPIPRQSSYFTAAAAFAAHWLRKTFRKWVTPMWNPWTGVGRAGFQQDYPRSKADNLARFVSLSKIWLGREDSNLHHPH